MVAPELSMARAGVFCSTFAKTNLPTMTHDELKQFDSILNDHDNEWDMFAWCVGREPLPEYLQKSSVMAAVMVHTRNVKVVKNVMPALN